MRYKATTDVENNPVGAVGALPEPRVDLLGALLLLAQNKKLISKVVLAATALTTLVVALIPNTFTATAKVMPPQQSPSLSTFMMGQLGPLAGLATAGKDLGLKNPSDLYQTMLQSRTVASALIARFDLQRVYGEDTVRDTEEELKDRTRISVAKDGVINLEVEDHDPKRAAGLANAYVEELQRVSQTLAGAEASQRKRFFEEQLLHAKDDLSRAELELKRTQEKTGLIELNSQARVIIESVARLRAQVTSKQVQLQAMRSYAAPGNAELLRTEEELRALRTQLSHLEAAQTPQEQGSTQVPTGQVPASGLAFVRSLREVKYYELVFELLAKQFEAAKLDEAKSATNIQVLDRAVEPEKKSKPKRALIIAFFCMLSFLMTSIFVLMREGFRQRKQDVEFAARLEVLRSYIVPRRPQS
jgi:tyrosine-protein kinase Etk/Wzc